MPRSLTRRTFLQRAAAVCIVPAGVPSLARAFPANDTVRHAAFGVRGMGGYDLRQISSHPRLEVAVLCDIDDRHLADAAKDHPKAKKANDFRRVFDDLAKEFDSCHVTVPDHMHAPIAMTAVHHGKHVYCQKPLTHEIVEARKLRKAAEEAGVTTQMGIQIHSHEAYRTGVRLLRDGAIGKVREVHTWADRAWGNDGRPEPAEPPDWLHWDLWIGVAPWRPWGPGAYHPKKWWSWLDFGTGNLGDMGCHLFDPVAGGLELGPPRSVRAECDPPKDETWPRSGKLHYEFPGTAHTTDPVHMTWYDGGFAKGHHPPAELARLEEGESLPSQGSIFVGEKGALLLPHWSTPKLRPKADFEGFEMPDVGSRNHWHSFVDACRGEGETGAGFSFAGPLTESVLLGNLARRLPGQVLHWDPEGLRVTNVPEANGHLMREYREGWSIRGLS